MRFIFAAVLSAFAVGASAQSEGLKPSMEPANSPFTYEALGATPSLRLQKSQPKNETPATATAEQRSFGKSSSKTSAVEPTDETAAAGDRNRVARGATK